MSNEITLRFLGHSAWDIRHDGCRLLIDPFITGNPSAPVSAGDLDATHIIRPNMTIPTHYDTFSAIGGGAGDFRWRIGEKGFTGHLLQPGESYAPAAEG